MVLSQHKLVYAPVANFQYISVAYGNYSLDKIDYMQKGNFGQSMKSGLEAEKTFGGLLGEVGASYDEGLNKSSISLTEQDGMDSRDFPRQI